MSSNSRRNSLSVRLNNSKPRNNVRLSSSKLPSNAPNSSVSVKLSAPPDRLTQTNARSATNVGNRTASASTRTRMNSDNAGNRIVNAFSRIRNSNALSNSDVNRNVSVCSKLRNNSAPHSSVSVMAYATHRRIQTGSGIGIVNRTEIGNAANANSKRSCVVVNQETIASTAPTTISSATGVSIRNDARTSIASSGLVSRAMHCNDSEYLSSNVVVRSCATSKLIWSA